MSSYPPFEAELGWLSRAGAAIPGTTTSHQQQQRQRSEEPSAGPSNVQASPRRRGGATAVAATATAAASRGNGREAAWKRYRGALSGREGNLFVGRLLALYFVATGVFEDPMTRRPLSLRECSLDAYLRRHKLGPPWPMWRRPELKAKKRPRTRSGSPNRSGVDGLR